jgi:hypothetical protein
MKVIYRLVALVALMLVANVRVQAQQKEESRVDRLVRNHGDNHEEHDRACHEAIQAAVSKKRKINPYSHHYVNDIMQLQSLRREVEAKCALFEYVSPEDRHELISFMAVAQSRDSRASALKCPARYSCAPLKTGREYNRATGKLEAAQ